MNRVLLLGRLTRDPDIRQSGGDNTMTIARYTLAVDRRFQKRDGNDSGQQTADFISCVVFGRGAEFADRYLHKGSKICITGRIQTGSYTNRDGQKVYTTDVVVDEQEFAESKNSAGGSEEYQAGNSNRRKPTEGPGGFMNVPDWADDDIPFS